MPSDKARTPYTATQLTVMRKIAAEALTGLAQRSFSTEAMEWGNLNEPAAREALSDAMMMDIRPCGFFTRDDLPLCGDSPDGIILDNGVCELKCPDSHTHLMYMLDSDTLYKQYRWQLLGHMLFTGAEFGALASYDPRMPKGKRLVIAEPPVGYLSDIDKLKARLIDVSDKLKEWIA